MTQRRFAVAAGVAFLVWGLAGAPAPAAAGATEFAGSEACRACHAAEYASWQGTYHSRMVRPREEGILKDVVEKWATDGANPGPATGNVTGASFALADVVHVIGGKWKQRFLVKNETTGGSQFLNKQFNRMSGKWEPYGNKNDWDTMCATCHATGYRLTAYDPANPKAQKAAWSELNVGCEACHGPGAAHVKSKAKADIYTFAGKPLAEQTRVCGYCHVRVENELYRSAQGNPREDLPAPRVGDTFRPAEDWTAWYPEHVVMPGIQPEDKVDADYAGDLKGLFLKDEAAKAIGAYDSAKHHQEYQDFRQSRHFREGIVSCIDCHSGHAGEKRAMKVPAESCAKCHDASFTVDKYMPATGKTADNLFVRSHTFSKNQNRTGGPTAKGVPEYQKR